jgi:hypothetical protein
VVLMAAVAEVEARHGHAGAQQLLNHLHRARHRAQGAHHLRSAARSMAAEAAWAPCARVPAPGGRYHRGCSPRWRGCRPAEVRGGVRRRECAGCCMPSSGDASETPARAGCAAALRHQFTDARQHAMPIAGAALGAVGCGNRQQRSRGLTAAGRPPCPPPTPTLARGASHLGPTYGGWRVGQHRVQSELNWHLGVSG